MKYQLIGNTFYIGTTKSGDMFLFDKEDFSKVSQHSWSKTHGYFMTYDSTLKRNIYLHALIMGTYINRNPKLIVDHINHNRTDNRKKNLRLVTYKKNSRNCSLSKRNTSGYTGVTWNSGKNKWQSTIRINGKLIMLGMYKTIEEAAKKRSQAELKYF